MKSGVCIYSIRDSQGELLGALIAHVDDLLFCGAQEFRKGAIQAIRTFRTGDLETSTRASPIAFAGLKIELDSPTTIPLSHQMYAVELSHMGITEYIHQKKIANPAGLKSTPHQGLGALIWLHWARPDIAFANTQIATQIFDAFVDQEKALQLAHLYSAIAKFVKNHSQEIRYNRFLSTNSEAHQASVSLSWKLFVFADAGFGTLIQNYSVESHVVVLGDVTDRYGIAECHGLMLAHRCAKIHRVFRPMVDAEPNAAVTAVDVAVWLQVLLTEIFTLDLDYRRRAPPSEFQLPNPFTESPSNDEVGKEADLNKIRALMIADHSAKPILSGRFQEFRATCKVATMLSTMSLNQLSDTTISTAVLNRRPAVLFLPVILTDFCSLYGAILRLHPNTNERRTRITLSFLHDSM